MNNIRKYFVAGLVAFLPLALTVKLLIVTFNIADGFLGKYIEPYFSQEFGFYFRGFSILACLVLILIIGFLVTNFLGRRIYPLFEKLLLQLPFFKQVYPAFKEISLFLFSGEKMNFRKVVLIQYPRQGLYSVGFLTNDVPAKVAGRIASEMAYVFVPHTPSPLTGFLTLAPKTDLVYPDITVEEALKIVVSGGVIKGQLEELSI